MKSITRISLLLLTIITLASCESERIFTIQMKQKAVLDDQITVKLSAENGEPFEKALFFVNGKEISVTDNTFTLDTKAYGVGKHSVAALVYYGEGKSKRVDNSVEVFANAPYKGYNYKVVNRYPHDKEAYTQGLEYYDGILYESTGQWKKSSLRKTDLKTGKVLQKTKLEDHYFGEGMTIFNDKIHMLTWKAGKGFIYEKDSLTREKEFKYGKSKEGWGLTHSETELIKSDGTNRIWFLDPETHQEKRSIQVYYDKGTVNKLNELEYINGKIFANWWITEKPIKSVIVVINPENGVVERVLNLNKLREEILKDQKLADDDVLNGIAHDPVTNHLFVTGKNWGKVFEIELID